MRQGGQVTFKPSRAHVDVEIAQHGMYDIHSRSNFSSPIFCLPPELLPIIFVCCASGYHDDPQLLTSDVPHWVNVSYVCRYWRAAALDCRTLWTYHFVVSLRWTRELLARSKQALLKVSGHFHFKPVYSRVLAMKILMTRVERIQELHLNIPEEIVIEIISLLSSRAPCLQSLKIIAPNRPSVWKGALFRGDTLALRALELSDCPAPLYSFNTSGLTTLSLRHVPVDFQQNMVEFLATLSRMQELTHLYLCDALASAADFLHSVAFDAFKKVKFPHLSRVLIDAPLSTVIAFLSCVNIPSTTELRLECHSEDNSFIDHYGLFSSLLAQRFSVFEDRMLQGPTVRSLMIDSTPGGATLIFSASERDCDSLDSTVSCQHWGGDAPLKIAFRWGLSRSRSDEDHFINNILDSMSLTNVHSAHFIAPPFLPAFWRKRLAHLQGLRYIKLSGGNMPDLASVLSLTPYKDEEQKKQDGDRDSDILVPGLEELELHQITFSPDDDSYPPEPAITRCLLFDALSARNVPHGRVTMTQCRVGKFKMWDVGRAWDGQLVQSVRTRYFWE